MLTNFAISFFKNSDASDSLTLQVVGTGSSLPLAGDLYSSKTGFEVREPLTQRAISPW
jgi:hypothetical protein